MSDTPRTDEQINGKSCTRFEVLAGDSLRNASVPSEFTRQLERELTAANTEIEEKRKDVVWLATEKAKLENYVTELENRLRALWDKYDGDRKHYMDRIKRLEQAGDELIWAFCPASISMMTERESDALKLWNEAKEAKP